MNCLVVYESMFGNTHEVAEAIQRGLAHVGSVDVVPVAQVDADDLEGIDLLVVGGPTHVHGMVRPTTRDAAVEQAEGDDDLELDPDALGPGLREWLAELPKVSDIACAAFDTRIDKPVLLVGSAAKGISKRVRRLGYDQIVSPESFFVVDSAGPLAEGELDRARAWGATLAHEMGRVERLKH